MALSDIVSESMQWMDEAACVGNPEPFDNYETNRSFAEEVDELCLNCPVIKECFEMGSKGQYGQWGGIFWNISGKPDLKYNEHKSQEYLDRVRELVE